MKLSDIYGPKESNGWIKNGARVEFPVERTDRCIKGFSWSSRWTQGPDVSKASLSWKRFFPTTFRPSERDLYWIRGKASERERFRVGGLGGGRWARGDGWDVWASGGRPCTFMRAKVLDIAPNERVWEVWFGFVGARFWSQFRKLSLACQCRMNRFETTPKSI